MLPPDEEPVFGVDVTEPPFGPAVITPEEELPDEIPAELLPGPPTVTLDEEPLEVPPPIPPL